MGLFRFLLSLANRHTWEYRNPFDRVCTKCGRHENAYQYSWGGRSWWEEVYPKPMNSLKCCQ